MRSSDPTKTDALVPARRRVLHAVAAGGALAAVGGLSACASSMMAPEPKDAAKMGDDAVLVVGRIELVPALRPGEQDFSGAPMLLQTEPYRERFLMTPGAQRVRSPKWIWTPDYLNPPLEQTFFLQMSRAKPFIVFARLYMAMRTSGGLQQDTELRLPAPIDLGMQPGDTAIYVGTWRIWRDEFHTVTRVQVIDQQAQAAADVRRRFGRDVPMRKSLAQFARN